jgi:hypothetical protein
VPPAADERVVGGLLHPECCDLGLTLDLVNGVRGAADRRAEDLRQSFKNSARIAACRKVKPHAIAEVGADTSDGRVEADVSISFR